MLFIGIPIYRAENEVSLKGLSVIIDAGHGGIDSGAQYNGIKEKNINLALSLRLGEALQKAGAEISYTRDSDVDYYTKGTGGKRNDLLKRVEMINASPADLFISIHCNANNNERWHGGQVYYNAVNSENELLAACLQRELRNFDKTNKRAEKNDKAILILKESEKTGVLVEVGFLSNYQDSQLLKSNTKLEELTQHLLKGIETYYLAKKDKCV